MKKIIIKQWKSNGRERVDLSITFPLTSCIIKDGWILLKERKKKGKRKIIKRTNKKK